MIEADDELDVFFGFGFCQGQDRAVQIELSKRAASGTLSELFGPGTLRLDRLFRRAGLRHAAEEQFEVLSPLVASILTAFAAGVNAGCDLGLPVRPHEMALLRAGLSGFTAIDVVSYPEAPIVHYAVQLGLRTREADGVEPGRPRRAP